MEKVDERQEENIIEQTFWRLTEFSEKVGGKHRNTIDTWFNQLESRGIHYVNRTQSGERVFDDLDLKIAKFIAQKRDEKWSLEGIYDNLPTQYPLREFPADDSNTKSEMIDTVAVYKKINAEVSKQLEEMLEPYKKQIELLVKDNASLRNLVIDQTEKIDTLQKGLLALPNPVEQDNSAINEDLEKLSLTIKHLEEELTESKLNGKRQRMLEQRVKRELRLEALSKWNEKPESERFDTVGFISKKKIEKADAKRVFIEEYELENFENRLRKIEDEERIK
ncbi:hypothetical protein [Gottfriedia solisilvae]|uniref:MerR family transcriptional regulator n=1 Tax=Gottfriedia solisilvae TaxID=1516104 RepID=A0A8J3ASJ5_9BACI|nr:hypothetical protein [Gottfriedia solisilvae]GGI18039.1 hypothetical protein GCM10007380_40940 [Gottfriedia solisilvae]